MYVLFMNSSVLSKVLDLGPYEATRHRLSRLNLINTASSNTICPTCLHPELSAMPVCFLKTRRTRNENKKTRARVQRQKLFISDR